MKRRPHANPAVQRYSPARIEARVARLMQRAQLAGWPVRPWQVRHDLRGRNAGEAWPRERLLRFNPVLGAENWDDFLKNTVAHEVAHLLACWRDGNRALGHGPVWREAMALFGCEARRCHGYDTSNSTLWSQRRWPYRCGCNENHMLSTTRHNRIAGKRRTYLCVFCGERLRFAG